MRGLSEQFMLDLKEGVINPFLQIVHEDDSLCLEIRHNYVNIYYRGGNIARIKPKAKDYRIEFDLNYTSRYRSKIETVASDDYLGWIEIIPYLKMEMDLWFHLHPKPEREFQQLILRENNSIRVAKDTDYYIADVEYVNVENGSRFDMLGVKWISRASERRDGSKTQVSFMEVKYGDGALKGNAGLEKHIVDMLNFLNDEEKYTCVVKETEKLFNQKFDLGLLQGVDKRIEIDGTKRAEFLLLLANHKPSNNTLKKEIARIITTEAYRELKQICDVKIAEASLLGYGLYDECLRDIEEYIYEN